MWRRFSDGKNSLFRFRRKDFHLLNLTTKINDCISKYVFVSFFFSFTLSLSQSPSALLLYMDVKCTLMFISFWCEIYRTVGFVIGMNTWNFSYNIFRLCVYSSFHSMVAFIEIMSYQTRTKWKKKKINKIKAKPYHSLETRLLHTHSIFSMWRNFHPKHFPRIFYIHINVHKLWNFVCIM